MIKNKATFRIYDELNDFVDRTKKDKEFEHQFDDNPSVKDTIESIGIPHTEIENIVVNDKSVDFSYKLNDNDTVSVYPHSSDIKLADKVLLRPEIKEYKFIVDANVAKVAKYLRMLGFNTHYDFDLPDKDIVSLAEREERIILSRDIGLLKRKNAIYGYFLRKTNIEEQMLEVVKRYKLQTKTDPLTVCLECNGKIIQVDKESVKEQLDKPVYTDFNEFYQCNECKKVFWKGSHYEKMISNIENFIKSTEK